MSDSPLYLGAADIRTLSLSPRLARESVASAFRDHAGGLSSYLPKASLELGPGHGFQGMVAASEVDGVAAMKWVSMAPVQAQSAVPGTGTTVLLNDYATGRLLAVMDGSEITLLRTAALSAVAASLLVQKKPTTIGFVGSGLQAKAHLAAFADLFPQLDRVLAFSRTRSSAEKLAAVAAAVGLQAEAVDDPERIMGDSDIIISMVPGGAGLRPFLDARKLRPNCFVSAVDIGRSWLPESLTAFDLRVTDSLAQSHAPYDVETKPVESAPFHTDLIALSGESDVPHGARTLFCFRGLAIADMALARIVYRQAQRQGVGTVLA
ncbi:MAG: ornithine cyclodeaminase family protein [Neorhizobium sp.]|nr:ornithine cyclodeaminase family protein [Neorhizobium sp.]